MAAIPQLSRAFFDSAFLPVKSKMPLSRLNGPEIASATSVISFTTELLSLMLSRSTTSSAPRARIAASTPNTMRTARAILVRIAACVASWRRLRSSVESSVLTLGDTVAPRTVRGGAGRCGCAGSAALELGLAGSILDEGVHPDAAVPGGEQTGELLALHLQPGVEVHFEAAVDDLLGRAESV